jgi:nicotinamide-nucleotide amidase
MHAEIISIGSELTSGAKLDTNSQWLSLELSDLGIPVHFHATMADDRAAMLEVFRTASLRSDVVLVTGGLGPTLDDLTRELIAELMNVELELDQKSLDIITSMFEKRGRVMADRNRIQAMFPTGSEPLFNPIGTAPGIWAQISREGNSPCLMAALPGVPSEMKRMYREQVVSRLPHSGRVIERACVNCFGRGESDIEAELGELTARGRNPEVGITASSATITLRIAATGETQEECLALIELDRQEIRRVLGEVVFGDDDETLESVVCAMLMQANKTLSVVEVGTSGLLSRILTDVGNSAAFVGGLVGPNATQLVTQMQRGHEFSDAESMDLGSTPEGILLAELGRAYFQTDYCLAISTFSDPSDDTPRECGIVLSGRGGILECTDQKILNDMTIARPRAAKTALNLLRLNLSNLDK